MPHIYLSASRISRWIHWSTLKQPKADWLILCLLFYKHWTEQDCMAEYHRSSTTAKYHRSTEVKKLAVALAEAFSCCFTCHSLTPKHVISAYLAALAVLGSGRQKQEWSKINLRPKPESSPKWWLCLSFKEVYVFLITFQLAPLVWHSLIWKGRRSKYCNYGIWKHIRKLHQFCLCLSSKPMAYPWWIILTFLITSHPLWWWKENRHFQRWTGR